MPKLDVNNIPLRTGTNYPPQFAEHMKGRIRQALGDAGGLTQFGVNLLQLPPGEWSGQRHWHSAEDEFVYIVSGEVVLVTDEGEQPMRAGDCAAFPANAANGAVVTGFAAEGSGNTIPEPTSMLLLGLGLAGFGAARRRRKS